MLSSIRRLAVAKCAQDLVTELKIVSLPIEPIRIATDRGITVQSWKPSKKGVSGFLMKQGDSFGISHSSFIENQGFINFTVGHELGHYFLPAMSKSFLRTEMAFITPTAASFRAKNAKKKRTYSRQTF